MIDGNKKGGRFMREVARSLSLWLDLTVDSKTSAYDLPVRTRPTVFTPMDGWSSAGDFVYDSLRVYLPWCIEAKNREGWSMDNMLTSEGSPVWKWWKQAQEQAATTKLPPMLIFKRNHYDAWVMFDHTPATWKRSGFQYDFRLRLPWISPVMLMPLDWMTALPPVRA